MSGTGNLIPEEGRGARWPEYLGHFVYIRFSSRSNSSRLSYYEEYAGVFRARIVLL